MNFSVFCDKEKVFIQENFRFIPKITYFHLQNLYSHIFNRLSVVQYKDTIEFKSELRTHNLPTNTPSTTRFSVVFKSKNIIFLFVQKFIFLWETFLFFFLKNFHLYLILWILISGPLLPYVKIYTHITSGKPCTWYHGNDFKKK